MTRPGPTAADSEVGVDDLDVQLGASDDRGSHPSARQGRTGRAQPARVPLAPALVFILLGAALGPSAIGLLSVSALGHLHPVMAVALATLGIVVGLGVDLRSRDDRRLLGFASIEAGTTIVVVASAASLLLAQWGLALDAPLWVTALVLGIGASATVADGSAAEALARQQVARLADLGDVVPVILGGGVLVLATVASPWSTVWLLTLNVVVPLAIAVAGWLLIEDADDDAERAVFVLGALTLLGGTAAYLGVSPLLAGLVAGMFLRHAPGRVDGIVRDDLRRFQHPLVLLLLMSAGALAPLSRISVVLAAVFVLTRMSGKLLGGWIVARKMRGVAAADLGSHLLSPGVLGLGFALSFHLVALSPMSGATLAAVTAGTLVSELIAAAARAGLSRA